MDMSYFKFGKIHSKFSNQNRKNSVTNSLQKFRRLKNHPWIIPVLSKPHNWLSGYG
jgi:hypothetical protein